MMDHSNPSKSSASVPLIEVRNISKRFESNLAVSKVSMEIFPGEVHCLLGDNGAGKSTIIKILSGVHRQTAGAMYLDGKEVTWSSPREPRNAGIATVHQTTGVFPLMTVTRNFFVGAEPTKGVGPFRRMDMRTARRVALEEIRALGIRRVDNPNQLVGTMSGGERQALAIARALYFGARVLILDEPTASLGIREAQSVLRVIAQVRARGIAVLLITHNAYHAMAVGDRFTILMGGEEAATFRRGERSREEVVTLMAGGEELESLQLELDDFDVKSTRYFAGASDGDDEEDRER